MQGCMQACACESVDHTQSLKSGNMVLHVESYSAHDGMLGKLLSPVEFLASTGADDKQRSAIGLKCV